MRRYAWLPGVVVALFGLLVGPPLLAAPAAPAQDIRDIHGPIAAPAASPLWPWLAGAGLVAGAAVGVAIARRARRGRPLAPSEEALRALGTLRPQAGVDQRDLSFTASRAFSFAVSEIVRQYVEEAFSLRAAHRTTEELLGDLMRDQSPVAAQREQLGEFLRYCDLAKFAGWSLAPSEMTSMLASAEAFVRATAAAPPTPASPRPRGHAHPEPGAA